MINIVLAIMITFMKSFLQKKNYEIIIILDYTAIEKIYCVLTTDSNNVTVKSKYK